MYYLESDHNTLFKSLTARLFSAEFMGDYMKIMTILLIILSVNIATAEVVKLKDLMEDMGFQFKKLAISIQSEGLTNKDIETVEKLEEIMAESSLMYPFSVSTDAHKVRYSELNLKMIHRTLRLESAIRKALAESPQDLDLVNELFNEINEIRKEGHDEFKID